MIALHFFIMVLEKLQQKKTESKKYAVVDKQEKVANYFREKSKDFS